MRPQDAAWWRRFDALAELGDLRGRRVLDVGCGTGALAAALAERMSARVWGVDTSSEMLRVARARVPRSVGLREGRAEALPFRDGWFERVVLSLVIHLVERSVAFAEAARVLAPGGRIAIATFAPEHFDGFWLNKWFPSLAALDRVRFPAPADLERELAAGGFVTVRMERLSTARTLTRDEALARVRGRYVSTFDLLEPEEVALGTARLEAELPATVVTRLEHLVVAADRS